MNREKIDGFIHFVCGYNGIREGSEDHKQIINEYCKIKPLPRGYKPTIHDSWCGIFVSVCFAHYFPDLKFPYECSAQKMWSMISGTNYAHVRNRDDYQPKASDVIFYRNSNGMICHVGIVINVTPVSMLTCEGNYSDRVMVREVKYTDNRIYGYYEPLDTVDYR